MRVGLSGGDFVVGSGDVAEELIEVAVAFGLEFGGSAVGDNFSLVDDDRAGAGGFHFFENVGREQDCFFFPELLDEFADLVLLVGVEAVGGLVEDEDFGVVNERLRETGAVAVTFGKSVDCLLGDGLQEAGLDHFLDRFLLSLAGETAHFGNPLQEAGHGHVVVERSGLGEVADLAFGLFGVVDHGDAADFDAAGGGGEEAGDHAHGGGLSGSIGSEESEDFALVDGEGQVVDGHFGAKAFGEIFNVNHSLTVWLLTGGMFPLRNGAILEISLGFQGKNLKLFSRISCPVYLGKESESYCGFEAPLSS